MKTYCTALMVAVAASSLALADADGPDLTPLTSQPRKEVEAEIAPGNPGLETISVVLEGPASGPRYARVEVTGVLQAKLASWQSRTLTKGMSWPSSGLQVLRSFCRGRTCLLLTLNAAARSEEAGTAHLFDFDDGTLREVWSAPASFGPERTGDKILLATILTGEGTVAVDYGAEWSSLGSTAVNRRRVLYQWNDVAGRYLREGAPVPRRAPSGHSLVFTVETTKGFLEALASNRVIEVAAGTYNLTEFSHVSGEALEWEDPYDGDALTVRGVENLTIRAAPGTRPSIVVTPRYANVLTFADCRNITLKGFEFGHTPERGSCLGGVLSFINSSLIHLDDLVLFGCGTYGLQLSETDDCSLTNSTIKECTYGILQFFLANRVDIVDCSFLDCGEYDLIGLGECRDVTFRRCLIADNRASGPLFTTAGSSNIKLDDVTLRNNDVKGLADSEKIEAQLR